MAKNEIDILSAFNDCVDRVNAGESLETCLSDYPEFSERLRPLLGAGQLVARANQVPSTDLNADRKELQDKVLAEANQSWVTSRRSFRPGLTTILYPLVGLGSVALVAVVALALLGPAMGNVFSNIVKNYAPNNSVYPMSTSVVAQQPTTVLAPIITGTSQPTITAEPAVLLPRPTSAFVSMTPMQTATPQVGIVATSVMQMTPASLGTFPSPDSTFVPNITLPTGLAGATMPPDFLSATPLPTATMPPNVLLGTPSPPPFATLSQVITPLNAGEIDDNAQWDTYVQYRSNYLRQFSSTVHDVNVADRQIITVLDNEGMPVLGARVLVFYGQSLLSETRTYANGQTLFFPYATGQGSRGQSYRVHVEYDGSAVQFDLDISRGPVWTVTLSAIRPVLPSKLDVLFLLDATGSMSDEIAQLQNNILAISSQIDALSANNLDVRYSLVAYRDRSDVYISQTTDFLSDVTTFQSILGQVRADGGGDGPESLNLGLHEAIQNVSWRGTDTVKLIFLVADAPPHLDYPDDFDYAQEMLVAAQKGIKIHPIASSGLTPDGEFIFRQLAQTTMGHFIFLTYQQGASGAPGETRPDLQVGEPANPVNQQQGDYTVERLDELVLRLITDEIAAQSESIASSGIVPQLSIAALYPESALPTVELRIPTLTPYSFDVSAVPSTPIPPQIPTLPSEVPTPVPASVFAEPSPEWMRYAVVIGLFVLIIVAAFLIGVFLAPLLPIGRGAKRKRKNDEVEIVEPDD